MRQPRSRSSLFRLMLIIAAVATSAALPCRQQAGMRQPLSDLSSGHCLERRSLSLVRHEEHKAPYLGFIRLPTLHCTNRRREPSPTWMGVLMAARRAWPLAAPFLPSMAAGSRRSRPSIVRTMPWLDANLRCSSCHRFTWSRIAALTQQSRGGASMNLRSRCCLSKQTADGDQIATSNAGP